MPLNSALDRGLKRASLMFCVFYHNATQSGEGWDSWPPPSAAPCAPCSPSFREEAGIYHRQRETAQRVPGAGTGGGSRGRSGHGCRDGTLGHPAGTGPPASPAPCPLCPVRGVAGPWWCEDAGFRPELPYRGVPYKAQTPEGTKAPPSSSSCRGSARGPGRVLSIFWVTPRPTPSSALSWTPTSTCRPPRPAQVSQPRSAWSSLVLREDPQLHAIPSTQTPEQGWGPRHVSLKPGMLGTLGRRGRTRQEVGGLEFTKQEHRRPSPSCPAEAGRRARGPGQGGPRPPLEGRRVGGPRGC